MRAKVYVADYAQVLDGKLVCVGLGFVGLKKPGPFSLVLILELQHAELGQEFDFELGLFDSDGQPVLNPTTSARQQVAARNVSIGERDILHPPGSTITAPMRWNYDGTYTLEPGELYEWRLTINGETRDDWSSNFYVAAATE